MDGYQGKILRVDLTTSRVWDESLDTSYVETYIGGSGLAARYAYDYLSADIDPLSPQNPLIFMTGPMTGTAMPSAGRYSVCARSPLTGIWGEANAGGFFGPVLKFAGYDGIIVMGQSEQPVWLSILDGQASLHPAELLWGLDTYETQSRVQELMQESKARVACIGRAGENRVRMASIINDHGRAAGRTGLGAVMGAKGLKAIGVYGHEDVPVSDDQNLRNCIKEIHNYLDEDMAAMGLRLAGTAGYVDMSLMYGDAPIKYYQKGEWEPASNLSGILMVEKYLNQNRECYRCPIACGRETRAPGYGIERVDGPEYETLMALGTLNLVDDLEAVIYAGHLCNIYGLDTISTGAVIALASELLERGIITLHDTGGISIRYGDSEMLHLLIKMIAEREGFGEVLAKGSDYLAHQVGVPELAVTINGLDVPMHDPRAFAGMAAIYALSPRGACHVQGDVYSLDTGMSLEENLGLNAGDRFDSSHDKGKIAARQLAWRNLYNALSLCIFLNPGAELLSTILESITGITRSPEDLMMAGKRIMALKRLLNIKLGWSRAREYMPDLLLQPLPGGTDGHVPDLESLLRGSYTELRWDMNSGAPHKEVVDKLLL